MLAAFSAVRLFLGNIPPWAYKVLAVLLVSLALVTYGEHRTQVSWDAEKAANKAHVALVVAQQDKVTSAVEQSQQVAEIQIKTVFKDRIIYRDRSVPHEIIVKEDSACAIPNRFVSMWNSANSGEVPKASSKLDESTSEVRLSDIEEQHERDAEAFAINVQQIRGWQEWAKAQSLVK